jgi:hypothetical protein
LSIFGKFHILRNGNRCNAEYNNEKISSVPSFSLLPRVFFNVDATKRTVYVIWLIKAAFWAYHFAKSLSIKQFLPVIPTPNARLLYGLLFHTKFSQVSTSKNLSESTAWI